MANEDYFREIAMTKHPLEGSDAELTPPPLSQTQFSVSQNAFPYQKGEQLSYEQRCTRFDKELAALRAEYAPYMRDLAQTLPQTVSTYVLDGFSFRYLPQAEAFSARADEAAQWQSVNIPDYRGPAAENGKWRGRYRTSFKADAVAKGARAVLCFDSVDYEAIVYLNGCYIGSHEGFFAPFSFDITSFLLSENELIVEIHNDIPILGVGAVLDGDKIYAATGPGWDDPELGWHHCPAGAGIIGKISLQYRPEIFIEDVFVRPDIDKHYAEVRVGIYNYTNAVAEDYKLHFELVPKNYSGDGVAKRTEGLEYVGIGKNEYRFSVPLHDYRLWEPQTPWLYAAQLMLDKDGITISSLQSTAGIKKFVSDEGSQPKGRLYLNNHPIILRGANEMGHLQQCVMQADTDKLIDDILIAKLCNLNYYRITQRPVQQEIYEACDMLGMLQQCDFPLFSFLRRPQFAEAVRQAVEMEHLVRSHVSTVMVTLINEPVSMRKTNNPNDKFSKRYAAKGHRHLQRDELEAFFTAARKAIYIENPDRVIKNAEGDYDPPTAEGMPDFHCYTMWYTNHAMPIGRLLKGYLPPVKSGWMVGCGEYGAEGLDSVELMRASYPKEWLAKDKNGEWYPNRIVRAQTYGAHGDWYQEQTELSAWAYESRLHQSNATRLMTDAFRRRADVINHTAIHLLIDAWPSGWMKAVVDCERRPKPAYFAYQDSLVPFRLNLCIDTQYVYGGSTLTAEAWLLNDKATEAGGRILITAMQANGRGALGEVARSEVYELSAWVAPASAMCAGIVNIKLPRVASVTPFTLHGCVLDENGEVQSRESVSFTVYPRQDVSALKVAPIGAIALKAAQALGLSACAQQAADTLLVSDTDEESLKAAHNALQNQKNVVLLLGDKEPMQLQIGDAVLATERCANLFFAVTAGELSSIKAELLYNENSGFIDSTMALYLKTDSVGEELAYTYGKGDGGAKPHLPIIKRFAVQQGILTAVSLFIAGRVGCNANLDAILLKLLTKPL